jgi:hypothetical protein
MEFINGAAQMKLNLTRKYLRIGCYFREFGWIAKWKLALLSSVLGTVAHRRRPCFEN